MTPRKAATRRKPASEAAERLDATPERLERAREAGQGVDMTAERARRLTDPFDLMRSTRALAPSDPRLNDLRWLAGDALRALHDRARMDALRALPIDRVSGGAFGPRPGLPAAESALIARDKLRAAEERVGPAAWPIVKRVVIEGGGVRDCRAFVADVVTPWRADAVVTDRLRVALDWLGEVLGVFGRRERAAPIA
jgi:hypothetical protein